ncbi:hypothetical protein LJR231_001539 [Phyllobacterium sp. LjRoot231]|uniref:hypothetical protein n=1 Tax=Phyllobacterium sp. LjRoot231 TaxID=3342289 RepID=UPI003ED01F27
MKAITIWQPWASLIMANAKPYEFRGWPVPHVIIGTTIAIHAGARPMKRGELADLITRLTSDQAWTTCLNKEIALPLLERAITSPGILPLSSILGTVKIGKAKGGNDIVHEFGGKLNDSDRNQHSNFAWPLSEIKVFEPFVPAKGMQGFWEWEQ